MTGTKNGESGDGRLRRLFNSLSQLTPFFSRSLALGLGSSSLDPPGRDLDRECGYPENPGVETYRKLYDRGGVSARVVNIWPDECWGAYPELYSTEQDRTTKFERAWKDMSETVCPWHFLHRADRVSGIGRYGALFFGLKDAGQSLAAPPPGVNAQTGQLLDGARPHELIYLRVFGEDSATVSKTVDDLNSPRYGEPAAYTLNVSRSDGEGADSVEVHWTRVLHLADNRESSEVYGVPRMQSVLDYLLDVRKVSGSSAEMFWKGGFPGFQFKTDPDLVGEAAVDVDAVEQEVKNYVNGLKRYLSGVGGSWAPIPIQVADPSNHLTQILSLVCATIGVPIRIFLGSESGHLASTQDAGTWKERLRGRQLNYLEPMVVRPFIARLVGMGCLPKPESVVVSWRDLKTLGEKDLADVALKKVQALMQYVTGGVFDLMPVHKLFTLVMGFSEAQADAVVQELGGEEKAVANLKKAAELRNPKAASAGGGRVGNPQTAPSGRPPG